MVRQRLQTVSKWIIITLLSVLIASAAVAVKVTPAFAGSSRYDLTFDETAFKYTKGGETVERRVYVDESLYPYLIRISYDVVSAETKDVMMGQLKTENGKAVPGEGITVEKQNVLVAKESLTSWTSGKKAYYFTVSADHCCAFVFTVYYDKGEGEEEGKHYCSTNLYLTSVDSVAPKTVLESYNVFMNTVTVRFDDPGDVCASSGAKTYVVYRYDTQKKVKETFFTSDKITSKKATIELEPGKYDYYVAATDSVGNVGKETLVAKYDVDELIRSADNAVKTIESAKDEWSEVFIDKLEKAYGEYVVAANAEEGTVSDEEFTQKSDALKSVLDEYERFLAYKLHGKDNVTLRISGKDYLKEGPTILNLADGCDFIKYGEDGSLSVSVEKHGYTKDKGEALSESGMKAADDVYYFTVQTSTTGQLDRKIDFSVPLKVSLSVGEYKEIGAVQVVEEDGKTVYAPCPVTEYTNGKVVLNVEKTYGTVYLFVQSKEKNDLKWLYLLFLLLPISVGTASLIIIKRRKRSVNNVGKEDGKKVDN